MARLSAESHDARAVALRARGQRLTPQRLLVLETIHEGAGHQTAEAIYEQVRAKYPYINRATVYRTLAWLKELALIAETDLGGGQAEYEILGERPHHHLVCLHCGQKQEFPHDLVAPLGTALRERYGFAPRLDHLAIFGLCRACQGTAATAERRSCGEAGSR